MVDSASLREHSARIYANLDALALQVALAPIFSRPEMDGPLQPPSRSDYCFVLPSNPKKETKLARPPLTKGTLSLLSLAREKGFFDCDCSALPEAESRYSTKRGYKASPSSA